MTEVRINTVVRRMRTLKVYHLEPSVSIVPCLSNGIAKEGSFSVSLYISENNKEKQPYSAYIRYKRCSAGTCSVPVESQGEVATLSVDTGKSSGSVFDSYIIEAYEKTTEADKILAVLTLGTVRDGAQGPAGNVGPMLVPNGSWDSKRTYRSTESYRIFVERNKLYYVLHKLNADCLNIDPALDVKNEYWRLMDYLEYVFVNAMVANFGKIGSAVFSGDYMLSQYGVGPDGQAIQTINGFEAFTTDMSKFIPNILLNFLTGYAHFGSKNLVIHEDGSIELVGMFKTGNDGNNIIIDPKERCIKLVSKSGVSGLRIYFNETGDALIDMRPSPTQGLVISSDGSIRSFGEACFELTGNCLGLFSNGSSTYITPKKIEVITRNVFGIKAGEYMMLGGFRVERDSIISLEKPGYEQSNEFFVLECKNLNAIANFRCGIGSYFIDDGGTSPVSSLQIPRGKSYRIIWDGTYFNFSYNK